MWSIFRRVAPSLLLSADYARGRPDAKPFPLWIKPDTKLSTKDVFALMRDHYENTAYDMTQGLNAGPFGHPNRWRDITWKADGVEYAWERPISTQQTACSMVAQLRASLPDPVGGVLWYGLDDTYTTCYTPLYGCIDAVPESFDVGSLQSFSWDSAWWTFNFVANSVTHGESTVRRWRELAKQLIVKYNDGYVNGRSVGYPEPWLHRVLKENPQQLRLGPAEP